MGGWIGFGMAKYAPQRLRSLIAVGAHPYVDNTWAAFKGLDGRDPEVFITAHEAVIGEGIPPEVRPLILANDLEALAAAAQERPSLEDVLPGLSLPCLFVVGEADSRHAAILRCARHVPRATLVCLPGLKHIGSFIRSVLVLPHVTAFLESVS